MPEPESDERDPRFPEERWGISYIDPDGRRIEFIATLVGPLEPISPAPAKRLNISDFRTWRID